MKTRKFLETSNSYGTTKKLDVTASFESSSGVFTGRGGSSAPFDTLVLTGAQGNPSGSELMLSNGQTRKITDLVSESSGIPNNGAIRSYVSACFRSSTLVTSSSSAVLGLTGNNYGLYMAASNDPEKEVVVRGNGETDKFSCKGPILVFLKGGSGNGDFSLFMTISKSMTNQVQINYSSYHQLSFSCISAVSIYRLGS